MYRTFRTVLAISLLALAGACSSTTTTRVQPPTTSPSRPPLTPIGDMDPMYFSRATAFDVVDGTVVALDATGRRKITMDPLPEVIFSWADGQHTIAELIEELGKQYQDGAPPDHANNVRSIVHTMERQGVIRLTPTAITLPSYLALPTSQQNAAETRKEKQRDAVGEPQLPQGQTPWPGSSKD